MKIPILTILAIICSSLAMDPARAAGNDAIIKILHEIEASHPRIKSLKNARESAQLREEGSGFFPDPVIKLNHFIEPIETRNGPQVSNIMLNQPLPWLGTLEAEEEKALSHRNMADSKIDMELLKLRHQAKSMVYTYIRNQQKIESKLRIEESLSDLAGVIFARLRVGKSSQSDVTKLEIERTKIEQNLRRLRSQNRQIENHIKNLSGLDLKSLTIPKEIPHERVKLPANWLSELETSVVKHPKMRMAKAQVEAAHADLKKQENARLPKLGLSVSWFQIDDPEGMASDDAGKDALAVGATLSIPLWQSKYSRLERSRKLSHLSQQSSMEDIQSELMTILKNLSEQYSSTQEIYEMFRDDIIPQASLTLSSDQESYRQGLISIERVIDGYVRLIKYEDSVIDTQAKLATIKSKIELHLGKEL